jgi:hypothetical protein
MHVKAGRDAGGGQTWLTSGWTKLQHCPASYIFTCFLVHVLTALMMWAVSTSVSLILFGALSWKEVISYSLLFSYSFTCLGNQGVPSCYRFIIKPCCHWTRPTLSWATWFQSTPLYPVPLSIIFPCLLIVLVLQVIFFHVQLTLNNLVSC